MSTNYHRMKHISAHNLAELLWRMHVCPVEHRPCLEKPYRSRSFDEHVACLEACLNNPINERKRLIYGRLRCLGKAVQPARNRPGRPFMQVFRQLTKDAMRNFLLVYEACPLHSYGMNCPHGHQPGYSDECWNCVMSWLDTDNDKSQLHIKDRRKEWEKLREENGW